MKQFDHVLARFKPKITDDLSPLSLPLIDKDMVYFAAWVIEDYSDKYDGQFAMLPVSGGYPWVPLCDLEIIDHEVNDLPEMLKEQA